MDDALDCYTIGPKEQAWCFECSEPAVALAGPGHPPYNAQANYFCWHCLHPRARVLDKRNGFREVVRPLDSGSA